MEAPAASNTTATKMTAALREELATVRGALANERAACRALQRDRAAEIRAVREEEGRRRRDALCDLRSRLEGDHEDALQRQKDAVKKTLDAEMLRELKARDAELRHLLGEAHAREEALKLELRDAVRAARDTGPHEQQREHDVHRLQQEVTTLRERNRQLDERLELVVQADRQKAAELRTQHEEHQHQLLQLTRTSQQEAHRLLEELRSKERALVQLQRRLDVQNERCDELLERRARESDSSEEKGMKKASGTHAQDKKQVIRRLRDMEGGRQKAQKRDDPAATPVQMVAPAEPEQSSDPELELELELLRSEIEERDRTIARLRQAAKEKDRKLDHLTNRHRKEQQSQLHKLFTELEPVVELEEEEDEDEEDSGAGEDSPASSGSPSLSPQPWAELYSCLLELQRENQFLQTRLRKAQAEPSRVRLRLEHELAATRTQVRELRKKLAEAAALEAEAHDLREQNELLEFRVLELQESEACTHPDGDGDVDVRARLLELAKAAPSPADRARLQQALALLDGQDAAGDAPRRIVATVLPFTSDADTDADGDVDELRRTLKNAECLQESGIFEEAEVVTRGTQTELGVESTDLSAEIQKLTQFRERVERGRGGGDERLQLLEDKARLQAQVERLAADNRRLDEERCELEEAENDARLKYQQLEGKLAALNERRAALQALLQTERGAMSRLRESLSESERKQLEAQERMRCLELLLGRYETRNAELEERESELRGRLELLQGSVPALLVWSMWRVVQDRAEVATQSEAELQRRVQELECKERAYMETLRQADDLWADVEDSYKRRVVGAEEREAALRARLEDSETRLRHATRRGEDAQGMLERLQAVEAGERAAQDRVCKLEAERGRLLEETETLRRALDAAQAELERMRSLVDGPLREELRRERARSETLQGEMRALERDLREQSGAHDAQVKGLKAQLGRTSRDLVDLECTNGELKEEVETLEAKVSELKAVIDEQKQNEEKLVISMSQTILQKEQELEEAKREMRYAQMPSAHEELKKAGGVAEAAEQQSPNAAGEPTVPVQGAEEAKKVLPVKPCGCKCMCGAEPSLTSARHVTQVSKVLSHKPVLKRWLQPQHWRQC